jgi:hypothetical protein
LIGAEVDMGAEECAGVRLEEAGDALGQRHPRRERVTGSGPGGGNAPQKFARSTRFQNPLELRQAVLRLVARDQRCVDGADRGADDPIPLDSRLMQRLIDSALVGALAAWPAGSPMHLRKPCFLASRLKITSYQKCGGTCQIISTAKSHQSYNSANNKREPTIPSR